MSDWRFVACTFEDHAAGILEILNEAIINSTALFDYEARKPESMVTWFAAKREQGHPVIGIESHAGELLAFGTCGTFRAWPAFKYTVEHSVYVRDGHRGRGLGEAVLRQLIVEAQERDVHVMIGGIEAQNTASIRLHEKLGFIHVATLPEVGFKFGRWLDLAFLQLTLATPENPQDG